MFLAKKFFCCKVCSGSHKRHNEQGATQCYQAFLGFFFEFPIFGCCCFCANMVKLWLPWHPHNPNNFTDKARQCVFCLHNAETWNLRNSKEMLTKYRFEFSRDDCTSWSNTVPSFMQQSVWLPAPMLPGIWRLSAVLKQNVATRTRILLLSRRDLHVEFLRVLGSQSGMSVWQHTLVG